MEIIAEQISRRQQGGTEGIAGVKKPQARTVWLECRSDYWFSTVLQIS